MILSSAVVTQQDLGLHQANDEEERAFRQEHVVTGHKLTNQMQ